MDTVNKEKAIRAIVSSFVEAYASAFSDRHLSEVDDEDGTINMKIHNVFIAALGPEIQYYSALARSLDSSLGNMLEKMAIKIATLNYEVTQEVEGPIYQEQTDYIAELLECYKNTKGANHRKPSTTDYRNIINKNKSASHNKMHVSDYYLKDLETGMHYLIELKIGGDLDNKKARSEKRYSGRAVCQQIIPFIYIIEQSVFMIRFKKSNCPFRRIKTHLLQRRTMPQLYP